jgi:hypothetical protein
MLPSVERNRAQMLKTALEILRENATEMIAHAKDAAGPYSDAGARRMEQNHRPLEDALASFDDALDAAVAARNEFVEAVNIKAEFILFHRSKVKVR